MLFVLMFSAAQAATITVCDTGCDATTVQGGVDLATSGDTVDVGPGFYQENVVIQKDLVLQGSGPDVTVIDGGFQDTVVHVIGGIDVTVQDLNLRGAPTHGGLPGSAALHFDANHQVSTFTARRNVLEHGSNGLVIWEASSSTCRIENNIVRDARFTGVYVGCVDTTVRFNSLVDNGWYGYWHDGGAASITFLGNTVYNNGLAGFRKHIGDTLIDDGNFVDGNYQMAGVVPWFGGAQWVEATSAGQLNPIVPTGGNRTGAPRHEGGACESVRPLLGSPLIDGGPSGWLDADGSPADIGALGGPDAPATLTGGREACIAILTQRAPASLQVDVDIMVANQTTAQLPLRVRTVWMAEALLGPMLPNSHFRLPVGTAAVTRSATIPQPGKNVACAILMGRSGEIYDTSCTLVELW